MRYHLRKVLASSGVVLGGILLGCDSGETKTPQKFDPKTPAIEQMKADMMKVNMQALKKIGAAPAPGAPKSQP
ncbi:MAG TPA: hypothetical protein VFF52_20955 [Isosphaeraceae bacterium]|nr:hypothetical protein [Isosphaeraceae bacterium]